MISPQKPLQPPERTESPAETKTAAGENDEASAAANKQSSIDDMVYTHPLMKMPGLLKQQAAMLQESTEAGPQVSVPYVIISDM